LAADRYKGKLRIRSCGLLFDGDRILLIKLHSPVNDQPVWLPPGGGVGAGETLESALIREFHEETGLQVESRGLKMVHELVRPPYHSIEMYFECRKTGGSLKLGFDPEHEKENQILLDLKFVPINELGKIEVYPEILRTEINGIKDRNLEVIHSKTLSPEIND
jgi:8-oxo-dGTP diphosphatase